MRGEGSEQQQQQQQQEQEQEQQQQQQQQEQEQQQQQEQEQEQEQKEKQEQEQEPEPEPEPEQDKAATASTSKSAKVHERRVLGTGGKVMSVGCKGQKNGQKQRRPAPLTCQHEQRYQIIVVNHAAHDCSAEEEFRELQWCPSAE